MSAAAACVAAVINKHNRASSNISSYRTLARPEPEPLTKDEKMKIFVLKEQKRMKAKTDLELNISADELLALYIEEYGEF